MNIAHENLQQALRYIESGKKSLTENNADSLKNNVENLGRILMNADYYLLKLAYAERIGDSKLQKKVLYDSLRKFPFCLLFHTLYADFLERQGNYEACLQHYINAISGMSPQDEDRLSTMQRATDTAQRLLAGGVINQNEASKYLTHILSLSKVMDAFSTYPVLPNMTLAVNQLFFEGTADEYYVNLYKKDLPLTQVANENSSFFTDKIEIIKGKKHTGIFELQAANSVSIPFSFMNDDPRTVADIKVEINGEEYPFITSTNTGNRFQHLRVDKGTHLKIRRDNAFFVGKPVNLCYKPELKKMVLFIFVDAMSYQHLVNIGFQETMPNTYNYFKDGFISQNCFTIGEWTYTAKQSILTGKYTTNHKKFNKTRTYDYSQFAKQLQECFEEKGYYTTLVTRDYSSSPAQGVYKGFDRIVYQHVLGGFNNYEMASELIEGIEAFGESNLFTFLSLDDLHDANDLRFRELYSSPNVDIKARFGLDLDGNISVFQKYDENRLIIYKMYLQKLDNLLGILFDYLNRKYNDEDITVLLTSDHGQQFVSKEKVISPSARGCVPLMIKDADIHHMVNDELISIVDIMPILAHVCGLETNTDIDGRLPKVLGGNNERDFAYTESMYPGQTYKACLTNKTHYLYFESKEPVNSDGMFHWNDYIYEYKNRKTEIDEQSLYPEQTAFLINEVFEHIKDYLLLNI